MRVDQFYSALEAPHSDVFEIREELVKLTREHPWFTGGHVLLCKADHMLQHVDFEKQLKIAAIYVNDRDVLFDMLVRQPLTEQVREIAKEIEAIRLDDEEGEDDTILRDTGSEPPVSKVVPPSKNESEALDSTTVAPSDGEAPDAKETPEFDGLQREIVLGAIQSSISLEVSGREDDQEEQKIDAQETATSSGAVVSTTRSLSPFATWLVKKAMEIDWEGSEKTELGNSHVVAPISEDAEERKQQLIDRFIADEPKIRPRRSADYSTDDLAKMSVVEDEALVTETMAKIYAMQGATRKAIKAYKLLSLKYPEKSIYFANQIKKLREAGKSKK